MATVSEYSAAARELVDRASGTGWALIASADGVVTVLPKSNRQVRRETVRKILALNRRGLSSYEIARELESQGVPTARGGRWALRPSTRSSGES